MRVEPAMQIPAMTVPQRPSIWSSQPIFIRANRHGISSASLTNEVIGGGTFGAALTTTTESLAIMEDGEYCFNIYDSYQDGGLSAKQYRW